MTNSFAALELHVSIGSQTVGSFLGVPITNAMVTGAAGAVITLVILFYAAYKLKRGRYNRFVGLVQWVFEGLLSQIDSIIPDTKLARKITPLAVTIFFVVLINYWLSVLPGLDSVTLNHVPLLRSLTADLNFTIGLALITMITVQIYAIKHLGVYQNAERYFHNPLKDPVGSFEGLLELIGEVSRGTALALRLFGNAFAGEVLLIVVALLSSYAATVVLPVFMGFEIFIGLIQAYVFFVLTLIFTALAQAPHEAPEPSKHSPVATTKTAAQQE